jgi:hypothetical protein
VLVNNPLEQEGLQDVEAHEPRKEVTSVTKRALETWFPLRKPLLKPRAGSGRMTSSRPFKLQLRYRCAHMGRQTETDVKLR